MHRITDIEIAAAWLRQREGETDAAWLERLLTVFIPNPALLAEDAKADRIGERAWARLRARFEAERKDT